MKERKKAMLFDSIDFKAMESSLNMLNVKQQVITNNLANVDTPHYKSQEVSFRDLLDREYESAKHGGDYAFETSILQTEDTYFTTDGNNVDADKESLELYSTYLQQSYIIQKMNMTIGNYQYVMQNATFR